MVAGAISGRVKSGCFARCFALVMLGCAVFPGPLKAQDDGLTVSVEQAITMALLDNPSVENAELDVDKAGYAIDEAWADYFPEMKVSVSARRNLTDQKYTFDQGVFGTFGATGPIPANDVTIKTNEDWTGVVQLSVTQPISGIFKVELEVEHLTLAEMIAAENLRMTLQDTVKQVKQQYYQIVASQADLSNAGESIAFYEALERELANKVEEQTVLSYELLEVQARLAQARQEALTDRSTIASQKEQLNNLMGRDPMEPFQVAGALNPAALLVDGETAREIALDRRPEMREALLRVDLAENNVDIAEFDYIPDAGAVFSYTRANHNLIPDTEIYVGLELSWEFFDWGGRYANVQAQEVGVSQARNDVHATRSRVISEVNASLRNIEDAQSAVAVAELSQTASQEKLRVTMNRFEEGVQLLSDVLDAESELSQANDDAVKAALAVLGYQADLARAMGEE
jgi:outer membrane protein